MLYQIIRIKSGRETVMMTDELSKVNSRLKLYRDSSRGKKTKYEVRKIETNEKYKRTGIKHNEHGDIVKYSE